MAFERLPDSAEPSPQAPPETKPPRKDTIGDDEFLAPVTSGEAARRATEQVTEAHAELNRPASDFLHWPFADLDALCGPIAPGEIWFVTAASGGGKTTLVSSLVRAWTSPPQGTPHAKVYVMALETRPKTFRTFLACLDAGMQPGDVLSGNMHQWPNYQAAKKVLANLLDHQTKPPLSDRLMVSDVRAVNITTLQDALKDAASWGADLIIIDHIDHIAGGDGQNGAEDTRRVNDALLRIVQDNDLRVLATSQLNMTQSRGDRMAKYLPPKDEHVVFGRLKRQNCTGMIGLYRPIRERGQTEMPKEYADKLTAARTSGIDIPGMLAPNTMGVVAMKLRNFGAREGATVRLHVEHGRVSSTMGTPTLPPSPSAAAAPPPPNQTNQGDAHEPSTVRTEQVDFNYGANSTDRGPGSEF